MDASVDFLVIWGWNSCQNWMLRLRCPETIQKKNNCFCDISLFQYFHDSGVSRGVLGPHFGGFGITWGTILVILEVPGEVLKFDWILGSPLGHPKLREPRCWRVNC